MDITRIDLGMVNAYLVRVADGFVLVDSGLPVQWPRLESALKTAGCLPGKLKLVLVTHGDWDHIGNCVVLRQQYGAKLAMHAADLPMATEGVVAKRTIRSLRFRMLYAMITLRRRRPQVARFTPELLLEDGRRLDDFGLAAKVLHIPGHTKGSIALLADGGELFAGDTVGIRGRLDYSPFVENLVQLKSSVRLLQQQRATTVYPGHGRPFPAAELKNIKL
jgi:glyoxylase-like metal-dependent hydrolase (beta-lactamase superfamily II)